MVPSEFAQGEIFNAALRDESQDWDLEGALARAILGDDGDHYTPQRSPPSSLSLRDEAEEERLIERLHARLFTVEKLESPTATRKTVTSMKPGAQKQRLHLPRKQAPEREPLAPSPQPRRSISPEKIDQMVARFRRHDTKRARKVAMLQQQQSTASSTSNSSVCDIMSPHSRELTQNLPGFQQRQALAKAAREREAQRRQRYEEEQQRKLASALSESVRSPCICGAGSFNENPTQANHTPACVRFMDSCEKVDASSEIQKKKKLMRRSIDDMFRFHEEKKRKQLARAELQRRQEEQETTFTPRINDNSRKIYELMVETGRLHTGSSIRAPELTGSPPPSPPALCAQSKLVLQKQRRTDSMAKQRRVSIASRTSIGSVGSTWGARRSRPGILPRASSFSESHWIKQAQAAASAACKDTPPPSPVPTTQAPWTEVVFKTETCAFILESFGLSKWFTKDSPSRK